MSFITIFIRSLLVWTYWFLTFTNVAQARSLVSSSPFSQFLPARCPSPPCFCDVVHNRKRVVCSNGISELPISKMDPETQVLNITAPPDRFNSFLFGRFITKLTQLQELHITRSKLPMIGDSIFCPRDCSVCHSPIQVLNFSQNNIKFVRIKEFNCLNLLQVLDLSDNNMETVPSAAFSNLANLSSLSLARNKLDQLSPLIFHSLNNLVELDLSDNPLLSISNEIFKDVPNLRKLNLNDCQLTRIDSSSLNVLSNLEYLDIRDNHLKHIDQGAFQNLKNLRVLLLNRNSLTVLPEYVFADVSLNFLDLSENLINPMKSCTFCNATSIKHLDLSQNKLTSFSESHLEPLSDSLERLYIDRNRNLIDPGSSLIALIQPLTHLKYLSAANIGLNEKLPESAFDNLKTLISLNLSSNLFQELNGRLLNQLLHLNVLDVSNNQLTFLDPNAFQTISRMHYLSKVYFHNNPFSCYRCHILPFIDWLNSDPQEYWSVCSKLTDDQSRFTYCAKCSSPSSLKGRYLHEPDITLELEWCTNPEVQLRLTASEPQVGLILAFLIILSLVAVILVVVVIYRKHGAVYYTQEDKLSSDDKLYASRVGAPITSWMHANEANRIVSLSSTNFTLSRQNTMFSPQSSLDQPPANAHYGTNVPTGPEHSSLTNGVCDTCANSTAVKQVIASIPAMTELLEDSIQRANNPTKNGHINGGKHAKIVSNKANGTMNVSNGEDALKISQTTMTTIPSPIPELNEPKEVEKLSPVLENHSDLEDSASNVRIYI